MLSGRPYRTRAPIARLPDPLSVIIGVRARVSAVMDEDRRVARNDIVRMECTDGEVVGGRAGTTYASLLIILLIRVVANGDIM